MEPDGFGVAEPVFTSFELDGAAYLAVAVGALVARTIWSATTGFFRGRTKRLREEIALYMNR